MMIAASRGLESRVSTLLARGVSVNAQGDVSHGAERLSAAAEEHAWRYWRLGSQAPLLRGMVGGAMGGLVLWGCSDHACKPCQLTAVAASLRTFAARDDRPDASGLLRALSNCSPASGPWSRPCSHRRGALYRPSDPRNVLRLDLDCSLQPCHVEPLGTPLEFTFDLVVSCKVVRSSEGLPSFRLRAWGDWNRSSCSWTAAQTWRPLTALAGSPLTRQRPQTGRASWPPDWCCPLQWIG